MDSPEHFLTRLLDLPTIASPDVRRGVFRQAIAALGQVDSSATPMALAGVDPVAFARSIQVVMADDLFEDLGFIRSAAAASAIHQMSSALPLGPERRALGRKVLLHLYKGDAETFATLASRMALGSTKALEGAGIRARVELCLELRGNADAATGRLALALALREELARRWVQEASTGSLPDRRMAAQLIERAAREAALRAERGDRHPLRIFDWLERAASPATSIRGARGSVATAWESLLADRESLVWRHVAVARGNLAVAVPELDAQIRGLLGPELSPTEWRRGATSLVASIAVQRARALEDALGLLDGPLLKRDPGIAMAMVWGVHTVAEVEPEAAEELLDALALHAPVTIAESLAELRARHPGVCAHAASVCAEALRASLLQPERDDGATALARALLQQLEEGEAAGSLGRAIRTAVEAFGERGTREAHEGARRALELATTQARTLAALDVRYDTGDSAAALRQSAMLHLRDLDANLFESQTLASLLLLDRAPGVDTTGIDALDDLHGRIGAWLLTPERREGSAEDIDAQVTLYQRELRTLLHLIDSGHTDFGDNAERRASIRQRWVGVVAGFTAMVRKQAQGRQTRALLATVARGLDALVRDGSTEPVDAFLFVATNFGDPAHVGVIAEASMHPEVTNLLTSYLGFVRMQPTGTTNDQARARIEGLRRFLEAFPCETTLRSEALRTTCATLLTSLEAV
ncbi:MAG: serine/threonine protein kinase, partial [Deltaproteobacteria bacterium]|nr:serine/threonine protein kinase [Deltaproteobacteria bacterium]